MTGVGKTHIGKVRAQNEDSIFYKNTAFGPLPNIYIVADGMGGHNAGEIASNNSIKYFCEYIEQYENNEENENILDLIVGAISYSNKMTFELSKSDKEYSEMGTTFVVCVIDKDKLYVAHIGDSRLYIINDEISQITTDHTYVMEMVKIGTITKEEALKHPKRSVLTKALGVDRNVSVDGKVVELNKNDKILLCSDGLSNMLSDEDIRKVVNSDMKLEDRVDELIVRANENGGLDNISVIVIESSGGENK